ncbi:MAG: hypothetical protein ACQESN_05375 [Thermotogota bacterium]
MKNKYNKKNFFKIFLSFNLAITIIFFIIIITILFFFRSNLDIFNTNNYSKLIISNISLKIDSIMKNYVNRSIFNGIPIGPIIDMKGKTVDSKTRIQGLFYEIESVEDNIQVNYVYEGIHYILTFNKVKLIEHLLEEYSLQEEFFFTDQNGEFLKGNKDLYQNMNESQISLRNEIQNFNTNYMFYYDFEDLGINYFMRRMTILQQLLINNLSLFISIFLVILLLSIPISLIISSYMRKKFSRAVINLLKGISNNELKYFEESDIEEFRYYLREIKDVIENKVETYEGIQSSLNEMGYLYEVSVKHNSVLVDIIGLIKKMMKEDFNEKIFDKKLKVLERNKELEKIDSEFYVVLKNDLLDIYESIKNLKDKDE